MITIINEINLENGSNYKISILKKYADNKLLQKVLKMTYDSVKYNFGVGKTSLKKLNIHPTGIDMGLENALAILEFEFCSRKVTGNAALARLEEVLSNLSESNRYIIEKVIERDLRINLGKTQINKVFKDLITKPVYMRCDTYSHKTAKNIKFPAIVQLKADGLACFTKIDEDAVSCYTRSGEEFKLNSLQKLKDIPELIGYTIQGELLLDGISIRSLGNGKINSLIKFKQGDNISLTEQEAESIENQLIYQVWDLVSENEILNASLKIKNKTEYIKRFDMLKLFFS